MSIWEQVNSLPEQLVEHVVGVQVDGCRGDVPLRFTPAQGVRAEYHHVTDGDGSGLEVAA